MIPSSICITPASVLLNQKQNGRQLKLKLELVQSMG